MNKIRVIDLLNKKANGEELPSEINCYNQTFYLSDGIYIAKNQVGKYFEDYFDFSSLDYEVEIIEDTPKEDKKINKLDYCEENTLSNLKETTYLSVKERQLIDSNFKTIKEKFDEIIDKINGE